MSAISGRVLFQHDLYMKVFVFYIWLVADRYLAESVLVDDNYPIATKLKEIYS